MPRDKKTPLVEELLRTLSDDGGRLLKKAGDDDGKTFWSEVSHDVRLRKGATLCALKNAKEKEE